MCSYDKLYSYLFLFIHITGKVCHIALCHFLERISQVASTRLPVEEIDKKSRNLQDEIYYNRRSNPFILDWFYQRLRQKKEEFVNRGAEELVTEALHSFGKGGNPK